MAVPAPALGREVMPAEAKIAVIIDSAIPLFARVNIEVG